MSARYRCPKCKSDDLSVNVQVWRRLIQEDDGNLQTDHDKYNGDCEEWDAGSMMLCGTCGHRAQVYAFEAAWVPEYSPWRHGGWYVNNIRYPSGAVGCVSRNYPDRKWRIVCHPAPFDEQPTFPNRDAAARAERELAEESKNGKAPTGC